MADEPFKEGSQQITPIIMLNQKYPAFFCIDCKSDFYGPAAAYWFFIHVDDGHLEKRGIVKV